MRRIRQAGDARRHAAPVAAGVGRAGELRGLDYSVAPDLARWATANCHLMRNRFNLVDLLDLLGLWTDERIDWALAGVVGGTR